MRCRFGKGWRSTGGSLAGKAVHGRIAYLHLDMAVLRRRPNLLELTCEFGLASAP